MDKKTSFNKPTTTISTKKKIAFSFLLLIFLYGFTEFLSYGAYRYLFGPFSFSDIQSSRNAILSPDETSKGRTHGPNRKNWNVIHPYFGFITEGLDLNRKCEDEKDCDRRLRTYLDLPFKQSTEENLIVGVLGGSVAWGVSRTSLKKELAKIPQFKGKEIFIYHMAAGGYKQPQQLIKLNYFLSLGAQFDIVINIDGFNEIAIPGTENLPKGVHPLFPRSWYYFIDGSLDKEMLLLYGVRAHAKQQQKDYAAIFSFPLLRYSVSGSFLWRIVDRHFFGKVKHADVALVEYKESDAKKRRYVATGPDYKFTSAEGFYQDMAEYWARSSILINNQCRAQGIEYYHYLQPNQHVKGSKPMSEKEKTVAFSNRSLYGKAATEGYPYLIESGQKLKRDKVPYYDLTMLFAQIDKELYIDNCCHFNALGYTLIAREIARTIENEQTSRN